MREKTVDTIILSIAIIVSIACLIVSEVTDTDILNDRSPLAIALFIILVIAAAVISVGIATGAMSSNEDEDQD